jgi:hypothetical protein
MSIECATAVTAAPVHDGRGVAGIGLGGTCLWCGWLSSRLDQVRAQPFGYVGVSSEAFAGGLVVAGADAGPGGQVSGGRERAHVAAGFGDDRLGGAALHAGDRAERVSGRRERGGLHPDLG